eukprot:m.22249 g.22249  ORF g.22249 m.22249 type:complete len:147 (-) comp8269_c0_seq1:20-460(-)
MDVLEEARSNPSLEQVKDRVATRSAQRKEEKIAKREQELQAHEAYLAKARQIPMDLLAQEWLESDSKSKDTRIYLVEKILPTLVVGLEQLLQKTENGISDNFNPVNWLAQWLIRNNPRFLSGPSDSTYAASLKTVEIDLKARLLKG